MLAAKKLRVGTTGDYLPFTRWSEDKNAFEGIDIEMARSLAKRLGVELELIKTSWPTMMADFEADKFDIATGGVSVSLERQKRAYFSAAYLRDGKAAITRCADVGKYSSLEAIDKPETRMVVNHGGTNERFAMTATAIDQGLFADLKSEQRLVRFQDITTDRLLERRKTSIGMVSLRIRLNRSWRPRFQVISRTKMTRPRPSGNQPPSGIFTKLAMR